MDKTSKRIQRPRPEAQGKLHKHANNTVLRNWVGFEIVLAHHTPAQLRNMKYRGDFQWPRTQGCGPFRGPPVQNGIP